ncbi:hypothetical protein D3C87_1952510 [compost metagenome]
MNVCSLDVSWPALAMPPVSLTWNWKDAPAFSPTFEVFGVYTSLPPARSAALISWPCVTAWPLRYSVPPEGRESMITDFIEWPSTGSENAKSFVPNT